MLGYKDFIKFFGHSLSDSNFQYFLHSTKLEFGEYDIFNNFMLGKNGEIDLGFKNNEAVIDEDDYVVYEHGNPIFSHFFLYPISQNNFKELPLNINFFDFRESIIQHNEPTKTYRSYDEILKCDYLIDHYNMENNIVVSIDYDSNTNKIKFISIRDNSLSNI